MNQVKSKDSNSKQGSELLEAVGGLAAEKLVNGAPLTAEYVGINHSGAPAIVYYDDQLLVFKDGGHKEPTGYSRDGSIAGLRSAFKGNLYKLSDLRTAIIEHRIDTPVAPTQTHAELVLHEQIKNLNSSRNFWRVMFFAAFICYGVAWWLV